MSSDGCSHRMCDLCGGKECYPHVARIRKYGSLSACDSCVSAAVDTVHRFACRWGGTIIDPLKPCGAKTRKDGQS